MISTTEELLDELDATRERTLEALATLPDEAIVVPGTIGRWSVADLLSILTAWDSEVVTAMMRLKQGKPPEKLLAALKTPDGYNAARYQDAQGRDLDVIFEDFQGARIHLEDWLSEFSDRALTDPKQYKALGGAPLARVIAQATYEHEARYLPFLEGLAQRWEAIENDETIISLNGIDAAPAPADGGEETDDDGSDQR